MSMPSLYIQFLKVKGETYVFYGVTHASHTRAKTLTVMSVREGNKRLV